MSVMIAALFLALLAAPSIHAGCYRNGRTRPTRTWEEQHLNHEAVPQLQRNDLPKSFNWCDRRS